MWLIFTIRSKRSRFEAHLQKTVKKSKKEQILRPIYKNGGGADFEAEHGSARHHPLVSSFHFKYESSASGLLLARLFLNFNFVLFRRFIFLSFLFIQQVPCGASQIVTGPIRMCL